MDANVTPNQQPKPERINLPTPEVMPAVESKEVLPAAPAPAEQSSAVPATPVFTPPPAPVAADPTQATPAVPAVSTPAIANDQDKIEKEWVEAAEQVIKETAGDPHLEEEAVENLQVDYLKKRYGKEVKKTEGF